MNKRPVNRFEQRKQHTRHRLMQAASELLVEKGFEATTVQDITDRADVGRGTFYIHFKDKDDIIGAILQEHTYALTQHLYALVEAEPFPRREYISWLIFFETALKTQAVIKALVNGRVSYGLNRRLMDLVTSVYEENLKVKRFSAEIDLPVDFLARYAAGAIMEVMIWWLTTPNDYTPEQLTDLFFEVTYREKPPAEVKTNLEAYRQLG